MRLATFNILHGRSTSDGVVDLGRLRACVQAIDPDILALQEVDLDQERSGMADLTAVAAEAMGAISHQFVAAISGTPGATWMAATGDLVTGSAAYGIAILSRYPAATWQVLRLPHIPLRFPMYLPGAKRIRIVREETRTAMVAILDTPSGPLTVANTHLSFVPGWNRWQLRHLMRDLRGFPGPHVLMGDLNMTAMAAARHSRLRPLATALTFPAHGPTRQLDHILTGDAALSCSASSTPEMTISDHRPLIIETYRR
ncbi:endonuclease/exonuclease/phosphatase family protein [soil metagenome]